MSTIDQQTLLGAIERIRPQLPTLLGSQQYAIFQREYDEALQKNQVNSLWELLGHYEEARRRVLSTLEELPDGEKFQGGDASTELTAMYFYCKSGGHILAEDTVERDRLWQDVCPQHNAPARQIKPEDLHNALEQLQTEAPGLPQIMDSTIFLLEVSSVLQDNKKMALLLVRYPFVDEYLSQKLAALE
jgi:hypothetical protein